MPTNNATNTSNPVSETQGGTNQSSYSTGDILYASAANTLSKLPISTLPGARLQYNGTNASWFDPSNETYLFDDFIGTITSQVMPNMCFTNVQSGTGSATTASITNSNKNPGTLDLITGTTSTGYSLIRLGSNNNTNWPIIVGGGAITAIWLCKLSALSNGTDTYAARLGLMNANVAQAVNNGIYFDYNDTGALPNWNRATAASNSRTVTDSTVAASTNYVKLQMNINAAGSSIEYFINGVSVGSNVATIPSGAIGPCAFILKSAGSTSVTLTVDYFYMYQKLTSAR